MANPERMKWEQSLLPSLNNFPKGNFLASNIDVLDFNLQN